VPAGPTGARAHKALGSQVLRLADALANKVPDTRYVPAAAGAGSPAVLTVLSMNIFGQGPLRDSPIPASILILRGNVAYEYRVVAFPDMPPVRGNGQACAQVRGPQVPMRALAGGVAQVHGEQTLPLGACGQQALPCGYCARVARPESVSPA